MIDKVKTPEKKLDSETIKASDAASGVPENKDGKAPAGVSVGATLPASRITQEDWDKAHKPQAWNETAGGRLAIRTFSRGIMGAMFFTAGGLLARRMMFGQRNPDYTYVDKHSWETSYMKDPNKSFGQIIEEKNPLQFIAKTVDTFIGKPIESAVNLFGGDGKRAVHFRPTQYRYDPKDGKGDYWGRTLGGETVMITFDFFCASIGDALGRDIAGWFDPAVKKDWTDDKGNIKWPETVNSMVKSLWRYVSYNGGEDWFVAIPYAYFMKAQRASIDKHSPGFAIDFDGGMNGGAFKVRRHDAGRPYRVAGSYNLEGIYDLQTRFTVYNMGTMLYRELYDKAAHAIKGEHVNLYGAPDAPVDPNRSLLEKTGDVAKWLVRGIIKGAITMTPSVPFFWITRGMQSKHRGLFVDPTQNAAVAFRDQATRRHYLYANDIEHKMDGITRQTPVFFAKFDPSGREGRGEMHEGTPMPAPIGNPSSRPGYNAYAKRHNVMENTFSWIGEKGYKFSQRLDGPASALDSRYDKYTSILRPLKGALGLRGGEKFGRFTRPFLNASASYTPYMFMKAETARLWDTGKMDLAAEGLIDGVTALDGKKIKRGFGEIWDAILHKPFADEAREMEAERRIKIDTSQAADQTNADAERTHQQQLKEQDRYKISKDKLAEASAPFDGYVKQQEEKRNIKPRSHDGLSHRERLVAGKKTDAQPLDPKLSHAEQEDLRKILADSQPLNTLAI